MIPITKRAAAIGACVAVITLGLFVGGTREHLKEEGLQPHNVERSDTLEFLVCYRGTCKPVAGDVFDSLTSCRRLQGSAEVDK